MAISEAVLIPYEITLLSNKGGIQLMMGLVLIPYEITLLSNYVKDKLERDEF